MVLERLEQAMVSVPVTSYEFQVAWAWLAASAVEKRLN
jgi:hypothetical protein